MIWTYGLWTLLVISSRWRIACGTRDVLHYDVRVLGTWEQAMNYGWHFWWHEIRWHEPSIFRWTSVRRQAVSQKRTAGACCCHHPGAGPRKPARNGNPWFDSGCEDLMIFDDLIWYLIIFDHWSTFVSNKKSSAKVKLCRFLWLRQAEITCCLRKASKKGAVTCQFCCHLVDPSTECRKDASMHGWSADKYQIGYQLKYSQKETESTSFWNCNHILSTPGWE